MEKYRVSIILPTYNGAQFIRTAIDSVLNQTFQAWELIILSDGSIDQTKSIVQEYSKNDERIIFLENEHNIGIQKTLNKGILFAKGEYVTRLDDDDQWVYKDKLALQVSYLDSHPNCVLVGTDALIINESGKKIFTSIMPKTDKEIRSKILSKNCFLHSTVMMRKTTIHTVGGYKESPTVLHIEDYELWLRLGTVGQFVNIDVVSTSLVVHSNSLTSKNRVQQAKHILFLISCYKATYPNFLLGYVVALARYIGFVCMSTVPIPKKLFYFIQRIYKRL